MYAYEYAHWPYDKVNGKGKASILYNQVIFKLIGHRDERYKFMFPNQSAPGHRSDDL